MIQKTDLDLGWVNSVRVNRSAVERRVKTLPARRSFKKASQAKAYLQAISCLDLTTLRGDDTDGSVERLCAKALQPVRPEIFRAVRERFDFPDFRLTAGAICVYPWMVDTAKKALSGRVPVASVATGFPSGQTFLTLKCNEIEMAMTMGATEIDVVIARWQGLENNWKGLYHVLSSFKSSCGDRAKMKTILEVSDLQNLTTVAKASLVAMMAGSDFIKTSTGMGDYGATLEAGLVMVRQIRDFYDRTKQKVGFKPAGGIRTAKDSMAWLILMKEELGDEWTYPDLFRFGASSLLKDLQMQLEHLASGSYSAAHRQPEG